MRKIDTKELTYGEAIKRIQKLDNLNGLLITEIDAQRARSRALSEAYLRLRRLIGQAAFETPHGLTPEQVWTTTEIALAALVAEIDRMRPVVKAACEWRLVAHELFTGKDKALIQAVAAYKTSREGS